MLEMALEALQVFVLQERWRGDLKRLKGAAARLGGGSWGRRGQCRAGTRPRTEFPSFFPFSPLAGTEPKGD